MRRSICLLALVAAGAAAPIAFAQDTQNADAGAPNASASASASVAPSASAAVTAAPVRTTQAAPIPTGAPPVGTVSVPSSRYSEETAYQLGRLVELEADRARGRRYVGSTMELLSAAATITSGAVVFALDTTNVDPNLVTIIQVLGGVEIGLGVGLALDGVLSLFVKSPMERMFDTYAPIAIDKSLSPETRVRRGEALLQSMAEREKASRFTGAIGSGIAAAIEIGLAVWLVADDSLWGTDPNSQLYRPILGTTIALAALASVGDVLSKLLWDRGTAELVWEHWKVTHEPASVQTSRIRIRPMIAPTLGGGVGGLRLVF